MAGMVIASFVSPQCPNQRRIIPEMIANKIKVRHPIATTRTQSLPLDPLMALRQKSPSAILCRVAASNSQVSPENPGSDDGRRGIVSRLSRNIRSRSFGL